MGTVLVTNQQFNIEALLACAFGRSVKMMRYVDAIYNSDKARFYEAAKKSSRFKSRLISGNRIKIRLAAQKALGVIMAANEDKAIKEVLFQNAERAFRQIANTVKESIKYVSIASVMKVGKVDTNSSDDNFHDTVALYIYFTEGYGLLYDTNDPNYPAVMSAVISKDMAAIKPFADNIAKALKENELEEMSTGLTKAFSKQFKGHTIGDIVVRMSPERPEYKFLMNMWDIAQLDNIPMTIYENEEFSRKDMQDIANTFIVNIGKGWFSAEDTNKYFIMALVLRSLARVYREMEVVVDEYAGIVRDTKEQRELERELTGFKEKVQEQKVLLANKQEKLNQLQLKYDRLEKKLVATEHQLAIGKYR